MQHMELYPSKPAKATLIIRLVDRTISLTGTSLSELTAFLREKCPGGKISELADLRGKS